MKDGHCHSSIGECGEEGHGPVGGVATADCYLVALLDITVFKEYMQFLYLPGYIVKLKGCSLIVGQRILIPVFGDGSLDVSIETAKLLHENCTFVLIMCKGSAIIAHSQIFCAIINIFYSYRMDLAGWMCETR